MAIQITGNNVYLRLMQQSDVATIATCLEDIIPVTPDSIEQKAFWWKVNRGNSALFNARSVQAEDRGTVTFTLCKKSDDSILGWNQTTYYGTKFTSFFSALLVAQRGNGYYSEMSNLRHKFFFSDDWGGQTSKLKIATTGDTNPLRKTLDSLYTITTKTVDLVIHGEYRWSEVTKDEWTTWINHSDRSTLKNQTYSLTWS
jgi:hypothetical protein